MSFCSRFSNAYMFFLYFLARSTGFLFYRHVDMFPILIQWNGEGGLGMDTKDMATENSISDVDRPKRSRWRGVLSFLCDRKIIKIIVADPRNESIDEVI